MKLKEIIRVQNEGFQPPFLYRGMEYISASDVLSVEIYLVLGNGNCFTVGSKLSTRINISKYYVSLFSVINVM
jgi:hypothetical protein